MARFPKAFAERNKVLIAIIGIAAMVAAFLVTFNAQALAGGKTYSAQFAEAGGLRAGQEVRIAGVKVGKVTSVSLDRKTVNVSFQVKGVKLGSETTAQVKVKSMLGRKFLAIDPLGPGELDGPIPVSRTTTPYDVNAAFEDLSTTIGQIDTAKMEKSLDVLADVFKDTPASVKEMVSGLTALSRTISSRDSELASLLDSTQTVTHTMAARNAEFAKIITDGSALLGELETRRKAVHDMLTGTARLGVQVRGLVDDNQQTLRPALAKLDKVSAILQNNQDNLDAALRKLGPYYRVLASATGNGRWVDAYICGLFDAQQVPLTENDVKRNCQPKSGGGR